MSLSGVQVQEVVVDRQDGGQQDPERGWLLPGLLLELWLALLSFLTLEAELSCHMSPESLVLLTSLTVYQMAGERVPARACPSAGSLPLPSGLELDWLSNIGARDSIRLLVQDSVKPLVPRVCICRTLESRSEPRVKHRGLGTLGPQQPLI